MKINVQIFINYKTKNSPPQLIRLTPEEYFDLLDEDGTYESDGIPKFNDTRQYLILELTEIEWTELRLTETIGARTIRSSYYGGGQTIVHHRRDVEGYEEIIIETQLSATETQILRIHKNSNLWELNYNGTITDLEDNSQRETKYY